MVASYMQLLANVQLSVVIRKGVLGENPGAPRQDLFSGTYHTKLSEVHTFFCILLNLFNYLKLFSIIKLQCVAFSL